MDKLYSWTIRRAGAAVTVSHSCGKITGITLVEPEWVHETPQADAARVIVATGRDGRKYQLR